MTSSNKNKNPMWRKGTFALLTAIGLAAGLAACGDSVDSTPQASVDKTPQVAGQVLGSYIQNAKVCLDLNDNGKCDSDEPSAVSDAKGKFSIGDKSGGAWKNIVADLTNARENDANGNDMGTKFGNGAFFLAPNGATGSVSAITTQLAQLVAGGATLSDAKTTLATKFGGVSTDKLLADFNTDSSLAAVKTASDNYIKTVVGAKSIRHVFVITLENKNYEESFGTTAAASSQDPYLKSLAPQGALLTNYYGTGHVSLDNYISMMSGQPSTVDTETDCFSLWSDVVDAGNDSANPKILKAGTDANGHAGGGCVFPARVKTFPNQLDNAKLTWKGYMGDMGNDLNRDGTRTCSFPARTAKLAGKDPAKAVDGTQSAQASSASGDVKADAYATRHNPFVYFHSIIDDIDYCDQHVVNLDDNLENDLKSLDTTPNFVFITPNLCDDGHDGDGTGAAGKGCKSGAAGGLTSIDAFLKKWIPLIQASAAYKQDGLIIINFDESNAASSPMTSTFNSAYTQMNLTINLTGESCCNQQTGPNVKRPEDQIMSTLPIAYASTLGINASSLPSTVKTIQIGMHYDGVGGDRTGAVLLSPFIKAGTTSTTGYNHYSLLKSLEDRFGIPEYLGYADDSKLVTFGSDIFTQ
ncbi:alkaline phosphatase family protein [Paraburkholderia sp. MMS20-SJTR3]|uniref:Alkaline phosphatase family protein n=1 Tax=Paraburkholderia sejongensis TaxID=2886946 RepID=A0ABS8JTC9_9BURK|nr:alkaline phosphatase family protein [Paraburkholderia sp. MMS20-SJTR3]MCC8393127.1 alkaline phosphatase family protein [Paraburkholderia sp. MMS20-SJTR3]